MYEVTARIPRFCERSEKGTSLVAAALAMNVREMAMNSPKA